MALEDAPPVSLTLSRTELSWAPHAALEYDVVSGDLGLLAQSGDFAQAVEACLATSYPGTSLPYAVDPASGSASFFLVRGSHCVPGSFDSGGAGQQGSRDSGIASSPNACP
jgi:hypothetical protein